MKIPKREPLLADLLLHPSRKTAWGRAFEDSSKAHLLQAKRFVLDDEATRYIGEMIRDLPRIIADAQDFAIPPFHTMWIEFPFDVLWNTINPNPRKEDILGPTDEKLGFLIIGNQVRVGVQGQNAHDLPVWCPIEYVLNHPFSEIEERKFCEKYGLSKLTLDHLYWGSSLFKFMDDDIDLRWNLGIPSWPEEVKGDENVGIKTNIVKASKTEADASKQSLQALRAAHGIRIIDPPGSADQIDSKMFFHSAVSQCAGDVRNLIAILLFLNRTTDLRSDKIVGGQQQFVRNKLRPLLTHNVITIKLNPIKRFKAMVAGEGQWRRLHDVRGHFCHNERARIAPCIHPEWEETKPLYWVCPQCKGAKWWRHEHHRGHEEKGIVTSEYKITK